MSITPAVTEDLRQNKVTVNRDGSMTAHRCHEVIAASGSDAIKKNGVPQIGGLYVNERGRILSPFLICTSATFEVRVPATRTKDGFFNVHTDYGIPTNGSSSDPQPGGPPLDYWRAAGQWEPCDFDTDGNPILYSNNRVVEPPPLGAVAQVYLTIRHIRKRFNPAAIINFMLGDNGRCPVNDAPFRGAPASTAIFLGFDDAPRDDGSFDVSFDIMIRQNAAHTEVLDHDGQGSLFYQMQPLRNFNVLGVGQ